MPITSDQIKNIRKELNQMKPAAEIKGASGLTVKQAVMALAPALERMKKRGFELAEIAAKLNEKGIEVKPQTLAKYLAEARRQKENGSKKKSHCSAPPPQGGRRIRNPAELATATQGTACRNAADKQTDTPPPPAANAQTKPATCQKDQPEYIEPGAFRIVPDTPIGEL